MELHIAALIGCLAALWAGAAALAAGRRLAGPGDVLVHLGLAGAGLLALGGLALPDRTWHAASIASGADAHAVSVGIRADALGLGMAALVAGIGLVVHRYARRYLLGDPGRGGFLAALAWVAGCALAQALSPGLVQFAIAWVLAGFGLQRMLRHTGSPAALLAARTKALSGRIGDAAMAAAAAALLIGPGTTDFAGLGEAAGHAGMTAAALAVVVAVAARTALVPFQSWLLGTVEAPTPLSALMHAGVVNAGGFLLIRLSPMYAAAPGALDLLLIVGLVSAILGPMAMWAQTDLKRSLAWSTVGQMGFMAVQCGLGAFAAAFLHLVGHGCYKADAFLRSGTLARAVEPRPAPLPIGQALAWWGTGLAVASSTLIAAYALAGHDPGALPGGWSLLAVQAVAMGQLAASPAAGALALGWRFALLVPACALYAGLTLASEALLAGSLAVAAEPAERGALGQVLAVAAPAALAALAAFWVALPAIAAHPAAVAWRIHAGNGFYLPQLAARLVRAARRTGATA